jgi:hypothetical protein
MSLSAEQYVLEHFLFSAIQHPSIFTEASMMRYVRILLTVTCYTAKLIRENAVHTLDINRYFKDRLSGRFVQKLR